MGNFKLGTNLPGIFDGNFDIYTKFAQGGSTPPPPSRNLIITEGGDQMITEGGDDLITE